MIFLSIWRIAPIFAAGAAALLQHDSDDKPVVGCDYFGEYEGCSITHRDATPHEECDFNIYKYPAIGMSEANWVGDDLYPSSLSWTQGSSLRDKASDLISTQFYVSWVDESAPDGLPDACAVIFHRPINDSLKFPGYEDDPASSTGICSDAIEQPCIDSILEVVNNIAKNTSIANTCNAIDIALYEQKRFPACSTGSDKDFSFHGAHYAFPVSFGNQQTMLNYDQMDVSGCVPSMTGDMDSPMVQVGNWVFNTHIAWNGTAEKKLEHAYAITPALMVTWQQLEEGKPRQAASSMNCLKLIDPHHSFNASLHPASPSSQGVRHFPGQILIAFCLAIAMVLI